MVNVVRLVIDKRAHRSFKLKSRLCDMDMGVFGKGIPFRDVSSGEDGDKRELGHGGEGGGQSKGID